MLEAMGRRVWQYGTEAPPPNLANIAVN
jgi:hypothetical protein